MPKKHVPKPIKGAIRGLVTCHKCGTNTFYSIEAMLTHQNWCKGAKAKADTEAKRKKAHNNSMKRHS